MPGLGPGPSPGMTSECVPTTSNSRPGSASPERLVSLEPEAVRPVDPEIGAGLPVVEVALRHVAQVRADGDRLRHLADQADGEDLLGVDRQDAAPGLLAVGVGA